MEHARLTLVSAEDYLVMDRAGDARHEFVAGQVFAMVGARDIHNTVALNIASGLHPALRGGPCRVYMSDVKLRVERADAYYYPDVFVTCDARDTDPYVKRHAVLVVEVLSPNTEGVDRREKLRNYRLIESLKEYVMVSIDERRVEVCRLEPGAEWHRYTYGAAETVELASVNVNLPLDAVYERVVH
jgi:Uma2 family endonuclease